MTRTQVNHLVAARTGESLAVIRRLGFQVEVGAQPGARRRGHLPGRSLPLLPRGSPVSRPVPRRLGRSGRVRRVRCLLPVRGQRRLPGQRETGRQPLARSPPLHPGLTAVASARLPHSASFTDHDPVHQGVLLHDHANPQPGPAPPLGLPPFGPGHHAQGPHPPARPPRRRRPTTGALSLPRPGRRACRAGSRPADGHGHYPTRRPGRLRGAGRHAGRPRTPGARPHRRPLAGPRHPAVPRV